MFGECVNYHSITNCANQTELTDFFFRAVVKETVTQQYMITVTLLLATKYKSNIYSPSSSDGLFFLQENQVAFS